jgi:hypothetical protein
VQFALASRPTSHDREPQLNFDALRFDPKRPE